jgi:tetratricopeptide (TPR) repeat protein
MTFPQFRLTNLRPNRYCFAVVAAVFIALIVSACDAEYDYAPAGNPIAEPTEDVVNPANDLERTPTAEAGDQQAQATPTPPSEETGDNPASSPTPTASGTSSKSSESDAEAEPASTSEPAPMELPTSVFLTNMTHIYQTWNNCSAASACMLLSYYDIYVDQGALRPILRPNDDAKHGKHERIIGYFHRQGLQAMLMHGGDVETLQAFLANDIPIIVQQWLEIERDPIGHYRVVRGYDNERGIFRVNDSMYGSDVHYSYDEFDAMWQAFSYRYIPVYPHEKQEVVDRILGDQIDPDVNRQQTAERIEQELQDRPNNAELWYSLGTNLFDLGRDGEAIEAYERAESLGLPPKMLWYVYWPPAAYNNVGVHDRAITVAGQQIATANTFGDMRYERGRAFEALGETAQAIAEYKRALIDDPDLSEAEKALQRLGAR